MEIDFFKAGDEHQDYFSLRLVNEFRDSEDSVKDPKEDYIEIDTNHGWTDIAITCPKNSVYDSDLFRIYSADALGRLIGILENHRQLSVLQKQQLDDFFIAKQNGTLDEYRKKYNDYPIQNRDEK